MPVTISCDVAIVGGGLAGGLIALALATRKPDLKIALIEGSRRIGGNHLWSFFAGDVTPADRWLIAPLIGHGWPAHDVAFPERERSLRMAYYSIESDRLDRLVRARLPEDALHLRRKVLAASPSAVVMADGDRFEAKGVIDCRGPGDLSLLELGWQKFIGRDYLLTQPHSLARPMIMDATVEQSDGYRFIYALPLAATRVFVEDTYYSETPEIDAETLHGRIDAHVAAQGWHVDRLVREEGGALPVVMAGDFEAYWRSGGNKVAKAGMRAGLFHPLTGYSLPDAVRTAVLIAETSDYDGSALHDLLHRFARAAWRRRGFYRMLATMLFRAAEPAERYRILQRFYGLDAGLIGRFYAGRTTMLDQARLLIGRPPVPVGRAVQALYDRRQRRPAK